LIPGFLGFLTGAVLFGLTYQQVFPQIQKIAKIGNVVIPDLWNIAPFLFVLLFTLVTLLLFYLIDRAGMHRKSKSLE
jgi:uncharacterized protein